MADQSGPFDYHLTRKLVELCRANDIRYQKDVFRFYRSDFGHAGSPGRMCVPRHHLRRRCVPRLCAYTCTAALARGTGDRLCRQPRGITRDFQPTARPQGLHPPADARGVQGTVLRCRERGPRGITPEAEKSSPGRTARATRASRGPAPCERQSRDDRRNPHPAGFRCCVRSSA